jgi:hypothetical protein
MKSDFLIGISVREFARRESCDEKLVRRHIERGELTRFPDRSLDPALVGTGWCERNRRDSRATGNAADTADSAEKIMIGRSQVSAPEAVRQLFDDAERGCGIAGGVCDMASGLPALVTAAATSAGITKAKAAALDAALRPALLKRMETVLDENSVDPAVLCIDDDEVDRVRARDTWEGYKWPSTTFED